MSEAQRCPICGERLGERRCPALGALICSTCCGTHRRKSVACPPSCPFLVAAERHRRERRARELARLWEGFEGVLKRRGMAELYPYLEGLRMVLAQLVHRYPAEDLEVAAALKYLAQRLSPIELVEPYVPKLGRPLEKVFLELVREGKADPDALQEACRGLAAFIEEFTSEEEPDRFVTALLGTYPPEEPEKGGLIIRP
ncbi:MAG TPA: hypothetical protein ENL11_04210 [Candidatus Acetothermia bacterium]|nr:hypothetical protein [Candidatus Acetothermia bacterium]